MRAIIRHHGEERWVDLDLDEEIRAGRLGVDTSLCYPPWTGERFVRIGDIPEAAAPLDAPAARLATRFSRPVRTPVILLLATVVLLASAAQAATFGGVRVPPAPWLDRLAVSWETTLLGGAWWTVWTAPLLHASAAHLLVNLAVLVYAGWRVERALGSSVLLGVLAAALAGSTLGVFAFASLPVLGASALAYGVWAAQITVGLRLGEALPASQRPFYGWGNLFFFGPLWLAGMATDGVSLAAHLGGLLGGGVAALLLTSPVQGPAAMAGWTARRVGTGAAAAILGLGGAALLLGNEPDLMGFPWRTVTVEGAGLTLPLPERFAVRPRKMGGLSAWAPSDDPRSGAFCGLVRGDPTLDPDGRAAAWGETFGGSATVLAPREALGNGWSRTRIDVATEGRTTEVVELDVLRGHTLIRCGYWAPVPGAPFGQDERFYAALFDGMRIEDPPALVRAKARWMESPASPSRIWDYAAELRLVGKLDDADALLADLDERSDRWATDAARARIDLWREAPALAAAVPSLTLTRWIEHADAYDLSLIQGSVDTLVARDDCELVQRALSAVREKLSREDWTTVEERLGTCRSGPSTAVRL